MGVSVPGTSGAIVSTWAVDKVWFGAGRTGESSWRKVSGKTRKANEKIQTPSSVVAAREMRTILLEFLAGFLFLAFEGNEIEAEESVPATSGFGSSYTKAVTGSAFWGLGASSDSNWESQEVTGSGLGEVSSASCFLAS